MNLEDRIKDIEKEISELKKTMLTLIKEITEGFKKITQALIGSKKLSKPMDSDCWRLYL